MKTDERHPACGGMGDFLAENEQYMENMEVLWEAEKWVSDKLNAEYEETMKHHDAIYFSDLRKMLRQQYPAEWINGQNRETLLNQIKSCYENADKIRKLDKKEREVMTLIAKLYGVYPKEKLNNEFKENL